MSYTRSLRSTSLRSQHKSAWKTGAALHQHHTTATEAAQKALASGVVVCLGQVRSTQGTEVSNPASSMAAVLIWRDGTGDQRSWRTDANHGRNHYLAELA